VIYPCSLKHPQFLLQAAKKADEVPAITSVQSPTTTTEHKDFFSSIASSMSHHLGTNATSEGMKELRNTYAGTLGTMSYSELSALEVQLAAYVQSVQ
jgi:hypothetical protein